MSVGKISSSSDSYSNQDVWAPQGDVLSGLYGQAPGIMNDLQGQLPGLQQQSQDWTQGVQGAAGGD